MSKGKKNDAEKPRLSLIPIEALYGLGKALAYGANKYGTYNFQSGLEYTRLADAAMRHITQFINEGTIDEESGNDHIAHALASLAMLSYMMKNKPEMDDRSDTVKKNDKKDTSDAKKSRTE